MKGVFVVVVETVSALLLKFSYSKVIAFNIDAANRFTVYPNPAIRKCLFL